MEVTTATGVNTTPASCSGPDSAWPVKVSTADHVLRSYMNLFERDSRPEVRSTGLKPSTSSVKYACADPHSVQYGMPKRRPPSVSFTISWTSIMFFG